MKPNTNDLYQKIIQLSVRTKEKFRSRGIVLPVKNLDGSISIGDYRLEKDSNNFYCIKDKHGNLIIDQINLPQTAAVIANDLALGKNLNQHLIEKDRSYGYAQFEEDLHKRAVFSGKKDSDYIDIKLSKFMLSQVKKELCKQDIIKSFEKLRNLA
jgi:hypothetical protein